VDCHVTLLWRSHLANGKDDITLTEAG
jgi:hypothetical protein